jgi:hypothetical protein
MKTSFREFSNNSSVSWFQTTNKIDEPPVAPKGGKEEARNQHQDGQRATA